MQDNWTLKIDPESRDLILDDAGALETISGDETTAQAVRLTLEVYRSGIHEHAAIAEAIAHRDGALAAQRMREHLQNDYGPYLSELTAPQP